MATLTDWLYRLLGVDDLDLTMGKTLARKSKHNFKVRRHNGRKSRLPMKFFFTIFFFNPGERKENLAPRQTCSRDFKHARHFLCTQAARISQDESGGIGSIYITAGFGIKIGGRRVCRG